jgi:hypothetical protein
VDDDNTEHYVFIDWGDGTPEEALPMNVLIGEHEYAAPGFYEVNVRVEDEYTDLGTPPNVGGFTTATSGIFIDDEAPTMSWVSPVDGTPCLGSGLVLEVDGVSDNFCEGNIDRVDFYFSVDGGPYNFADSDFSSAGGWSYTWNYDPGDYPAGTTFCFAARIYDKAEPDGNMTEFGFGGENCVVKNDLPWNLEVSNNFCDFAEAYVVHGTDVSYQGYYDNDGDDLLNFVFDWGSDNEPWDLTPPPGCVGPNCPDENNPDNGFKTILTEDFPTGDLPFKYAVIDECSSVLNPGSDEYSWIESTLHIYPDTPPVISDFEPVDLNQTATTIEFSFEVGDDWYWEYGTYEIYNITADEPLIAETMFMSPDPVPDNCDEPRPVDDTDLVEFDLSTECLEHGTEIRVTVWVYDTEYDALDPDHDDENSTMIELVYTIVDELGPFMEPEDWITPQQADILDADEQSEIDIVVQPSDWHCTEIDYVEFYLDDFGFEFPEGAPWDVVTDPEDYAWDDDGDPGTPPVIVPDCFVSGQNINGWEDGDHRIGVLIYDTEGNMSDYFTIGVTKVGAK